MNSLMDISITKYVIPKLFLQAPQKQEVLQISWVFSWFLTLKYQKTLTADILGDPGTINLM